MAGGVPPGLTAGLLGIATLLQGWNWPGEYIRFLRTPEITPVSITMPNLRGLLIATIGDAPRVELALAALFVIGFLLIAARMR